jgi:hypothetical protein
MNFLWLMEQERPDSSDVKLCLFSSSSLLIQLVRIMSPLYYRIATRATFKLLPTVLLLFPLRNDARFFYTSGK